MNFLKQSMGGFGQAQGQGLPPQLMNAINDLKRMQGICGGNLQAMAAQISKQNPQVGQILQMAQNGNPRQIVEQMCRKQGIDVNAFMRAISG